MVDHGPTSTLGWWDVKQTILWIFPSFDDQSRRLWEWEDDENGVDAKMRKTRRRIEKGVSAGDPPERTVAQNVHHTTFSFFASRSSWQWWWWWQWWQRWWWCEGFKMNRMSRWSWLGPIVLPGLTHIAHMSGPDDNGDLSDNFDDKSIWCSSLFICWRF